MIRPNAFQFITRTRLIPFLLLIALAFAGLPATPARAATIILNDQASCEALDGVWIADCRFYLHPLNVAAGDVLQVGVEVNAGELTNNGTIHLLDGRQITTYIEATNNGTITVEAGASFTNLGPFTNNGTITVLGTFINNGTITVSCEGSVSGPISGNPPQYPADCSGASDTTPPVITPSISGTAGSNDWYVSDVTVSWNVTDAESAISSQTDCDPSIVTSDTAGVTFTCTATSAGGTASKSVTVKRDATNPTVNYTGNAGTYTIDQSVSITCSAADNLSGIASTSCANIAGPAYSFALGTNTGSASATDKAGNSGSGSTTFTVRVTFDSLCRLSANFSTDPAVDQGVCDKLAAAKAAAAAGDIKTKNNNLNAYRQQVTAQSGKALSKQQATILINLSKAL